MSFSKFKGFSLGCLLVVSSREKRTLAEITTHGHSLSLFVIRCHSTYHSLSLDVSLVCLFINDPSNSLWRLWWIMKIFSTEVTIFRYIKNTCDTWHFYYLIFLRFIIFTFRNYFTLCKIVLCIWRKIIFFCHHNFMKKGHKLSKNNPEIIP